MITIIYDRKEHYGVRMKVVPLELFAAKAPTLHRIREIIFRNMQNCRISFERSAGNNFRIFALHKSIDGMYKKVIVDYDIAFLDLQGVISAINKYYE